MIVPRFIFCCMVKKFFNSISPSYIIAACEYIVFAKCSIFRSHLVLLYAGDVGRGNRKLIMERSTWAYPESCRQAYWSVCIMVYTPVRSFFTNNPNLWRCTMKVSQAVDFHLQYHRANSKKKYRQNMWVRPFTFHSPIWWSGFSQYTTGRGPRISSFSDQGQQTGDKKKPLLDTRIFL